MQFYHNFITQASFDYLRVLKKEFKFILIGGWAVFLHAKAIKSKDIDLIIDYDQLGKIREKYQVQKNDRLKKYEISHQNFDIDIYLPHYSELGIDIEKIKQNIISKQGFNIPIAEILLLLKLYAWDKRRGSAKGQKDELDIFCLAFLKEFDWKKYLQLIKELNFVKYHQEFIKLLKGTNSVKELGVNQQKMSKIKKLILAVIK